MKEVPTYKLISQSVLIDRMKINGSLARKAMRHLEKEGLIKKVVHHNAQWVYSAFLPGCFVSCMRLTLCVSPGDCRYRVDASGVWSGLRDPCTTRDARHVAQKNSIAGL